MLDRAPRSEESARGPGAASRPSSHKFILLTMHNDVVVAGNGASTGADTPKNSAIVLGSAGVLRGVGGGGSISPTSISTSGTGGWSSSVHPGAGDKQVAPPSLPVRQISLFVGVHPLIVVPLR